MMFYEVGKNRKKKKYGESCKLFYKNPVFMF